MRIMPLQPIYLRALCIISLSFGILPSAQAQRDPQALAIATQAFKAMGGTLPSDLRATGTYARLVGASQDTGSIQILTRSTDQTLELITNSGGFTQVVYSRGYGSKKDATGVTLFGLEKALASNSPIFPMAVVAQAVLDPRSTVHFIATESVNGIPTNHIRICTGSLDQNFAEVVVFATKDLWIASNTGLPVEMAYDMYEAQGAPAVAVAAFYSNFRPVKGIYLPLSIQENFDGTPYLNVSITSVAFDVGLTDLDFPLH